MSFIDCIKGCFNSEELSAAEDYRAVLFGDKAIYLERVKSIVSYTDEEVYLSLKKGGLKIKGKGLYIKKYCAEDVAVCGNIKGIERV
ncbi:MAG: hypothetical protein IJC07_06220 [Clostridia bacterium]|nr:hypothetical protein [Clostridia bacterium]